MKKYFALFLLTTSCSQYIIDPRGSKEPKEIIRDKLECKALVKEQANKWDHFFLSDAMIRRCLKNRGHSLLN